MMTMDRAIFELEASVTATSLYILLCALADQGRALTLKNARVQWNGTEEALFEGAGELASRGVLMAESPLTEETPLQINPSSEWH